MKKLLGKKFFMLMLAAIFSFTLMACGNDTQNDSATEKEGLPTEIAQADWVDSKQSVELDTGITMKYVEMGQEDGDPLILVHGMTDNSRSWSLIVPYFVDDYHVYMIDLRGHGDTDKPDMRMYGTDLYASDLACFMEELNIEKADIVGHSLGSMIAQTFAINYPEKVEHVVLESSTPVGNDYLNLGLYESALGFVENPPDDEFMSGWYSNPNPVDEEFLSYEMEESQKLPPYDWRQITKGSMYSNIIPFMSELKAPTLILWGTADGFFGEEVQNDLKKLLPDAEFISYEGIGHNIQWEIPEQMAKDVIDFLNK